MSESERQFQLDREALQLLVGPGVDRWTDEDTLLEMVKGKEVYVALKDENFSNFETRAVILPSTADAPEAAKLLIEDWQGHIRQRAWAIKLL